MMKIYEVWVGNQVGDVYNRSFYSTREKANDHVAELRASGNFDEDWYLIEINELEVK